MTMTKERTDYMSFLDDLDGGKFKDLSSIIPALRALRDLADKAEYDFIHACMAVEKSDLWTGCESAKDVTFGHWLDRSHVCGAKRYDSGAEALRTPKIAKVAPEIGMPAARQTVLCPEPQRDKLIKSYRDYVEDHGGAKVPRETAENIREALVGGIERESQTANANARIAALAKENKELKAKVRELESEVRKLHKRLGDKPGHEKQPRA
jgi:hypothetical protein